MALLSLVSLIVGYFALGAVQSLPQLIGLVIVVLGFRFVVR